jgi:adenylylsulfate kinase-like enzyme
MVIWLTGLSGSGKTTIAEAIASLTKVNNNQIVLIDGDVVRELFGGDLGFDEEARKLQLGRIQRLACWISQQNIGVVVAALYAHPDLLFWNRNNLPGYFEVYVDTPLHIIESRDTKGLYKKAREGKLDNVVGLDIPWYPPQKPDYVVSSDGSLPPDQIAANILLRIDNLQRP